MKLHHYTIYYSKSAAALEYVFRAAMILYNLVTSCQPWTFIHPDPTLPGRPGTIWNYPRWIIRTKLYRGNQPRGQFRIITLLNFHLSDQVEEPHSSIMVSCGGHGPTGYSSDSVFDSRINFSILLKQNTRRLMASKIV